MRPMRIGVARTMGTTWRVVIYNPTDDDPYRIARTLETGFATRRLAMDRAREWRADWKYQHGVYMLFLSIEQAISDVIRRRAPERTGQ